MPRLVLAPEVVDDIDRLLDHQAQHGVTDSPQRIERLLESLDLLRHSPALGRPARGGKRELVIGEGTHGFVALYRHVPELDTVFILALRHQREQGYPPR